MFEWDQAKSDKNLAERGFDFEYACRIFGSDIIEWDDTRRDYGARRVIAMGEVDEDVYVVVYTRREHVRRLMSARPASRRERDAYHKAFANRDP
jgi:uncharacterized DUF497 family protein